MQYFATNTIYCRTFFYFPKTLIIKNTSKMGGNVENTSSLYRDEVFFLFYIKECLKMIYPNKEVFEQLKKNAKAVPVFKEISGDTETPITLFQKLFSGKILSS